MKINLHNLLKASPLSICFFLASGFLVCVSFLGQNWDAFGGWLFMTFLGMLAVIGTAFLNIRYSDRKHAEYIRDLIAFGELGAKINLSIKNGWRVTAQTETSVSLVEPKKFSWLWFLIFGILYLIYYAAKKDQYKYLRTNANGMVVEL